MNDYWDKNEKKVDYKYSCKVSYYTRKMKSQELYYSHILICKLNDTCELNRIWKKITNEFALNVQAMLEESIERSNLYICFFVKSFVSTDLKEAVENDRYSSKKYIFDNSNFENDYECVRFVDNRIFLMPIIKEINSSSLDAFINEKLPLMKNEDKSELKKKRNAEKIYRELLEKVAVECQK